MNENVLWNICKKLKFAHRMFKHHPVEFLFVILFINSQDQKYSVQSLLYCFIPPFLKNNLLSVSLCWGDAWRSYVSIRVRSEQLIRFPFSLKRQWALISRFTDLRFLKFFFYCNNVSCSLIELYGYKYHISEQIKLKF